MTTINLTVTFDYEFGLSQKNVYTSFVWKETITERGKIMSVDGVHLPRKSNKDVEAVEISVPNKIHYLPSGLDKFFPQLKILIVYKCGLKELKSLDLRGLSNLEILKITDNPLSSLPDDLLIHTKKMQFLCFDRNQINSMSSQLISVIPDHQWITISFCNNPEIDETYNRIPGKLVDLKKLKTKMDLLKLPKQVSSLNECEASQSTTDCTKLLDKTGPDVIKPSDHPAYSSHNNQKHQEGSKFKNLLKFKELCDFTVIVGSQEIPSTSLSWPKEAQCLLQCLERTKKSTKLR